MARGLQGIMRFRRYQVDQARRDLGKLLNEVAILERGASDLEVQIVAEQRAANEHPAEGGFIYGQYAQRAIQQRTRFAHAIQVMEGRIAAAQDGLRNEYKELKVVEIAQENRDAAEAAEANRAAQNVLDEIGIELHRRRVD
jgi:flagellar export protein FliJ